MTREPTDIVHRLQSVHQAIAEAARAVGRHPAEVRLVAVSKGQPAQVIREAIAARQLEFGESTVQEALGKIPLFYPYGVVWHFIGHLQTNKAKFIPGRFHWLHSLDSLRLAEILERRAREAGATIQTLIEVNVTGDPRKHGVAPEGLEALVEQLLAAELKHLALRGLMTIGPHPTAGEVARRGCFATLRTLRDRLRERFRLRDFTELSMGMSGDYVEAIKEGATLVRIGTAIFGERAYPTAKRAA
jgi:pyridoxal phosphate enzyme (YggS family)